MIASPFFPPDSLPSQGSGPFWTTDIADFVELADLARELVDSCAVDGSPDFQQGGWLKAGDRESMGIFFWTSGSLEDRSVPRTRVDMLQSNETDMTS